MIFPIVLHHNSSTEYTNALINRLNREYGIIDSSQLQTHFTESFNFGIIKGVLKILDSEFTHVMICNNDITLSETHLADLDKIVKRKSGIFSPACNSPHAGVMSAIGTNELRKVPWVEFVAPIFSKDVLVKTGKLDTGMPRGWGIELDYCYRAKQAGFNTNLIQTVSVHHYGHKSQADHGEYSHYANIEMNDRLRKKYGDNWGEILQYPQW